MLGFGVLAQTLPTALALANVPPPPCHTPAPTTFCHRPTPLFHMAHPKPSHPSWFSGFLTPTPPSRTHAASPALGFRVFVVFILHFVIYFIIMIIIHYLTNVEMSLIII